MNDIEKANFIELLKRAGSSNMEVSRAAMGELSQAIMLPLREGNQPGDLIGNIFTQIPVTSNSTAEFELDWMAPGTETQYVAYSVPGVGKLPEMLVESDYVRLPLYEVGFSLSMTKKFLREGRPDLWDNFVDRFRKTFVKKANDDGFHVLLAAAVDRNIVVYDADAANGQFTKRAVSLASTTVRRNGGGNSSSVNRRKLTDLFTSPENIEDIRNWGIDQIDEITRREIYTMGDGMVNRIFGVNLHDTDEFGEGMEYQQYYLNDLAGTLPSGKSEISLGLDLSKNNVFVQPVRTELEIVPNMAIEPERKVGIWGTKEYGMGVLDNRFVILIAN